MNDIITGGIVALVFWAVGMWIGHKIAAKELTIDIMNSREESRRKNETIQELHGKLQSICADTIDDNFKQRNGLYSYRKQSGAEEE